jgi:hypothetical protein
MDQPPVTLDWSDRLTLTAVKAALRFVAIVVFLLLFVRVGLRHFKSASPQRL